MSYGKRGVMRMWQSKEVFGCEWLYLYGKEGVSLRIFLGIEKKD